MQSKKTSKKTHKIANEAAAPAPESAMASESAVAARTSRSDNPKNETGETTPAKRHRKVVAQEEVLAVGGAAPALVRESAEALLESASQIADDASTATAANEPRKTSPSRYEIAQLAYSYWLATGCQHGSHQDHWFRAERELATR
ncbi:MAG: DUF2934 domain-containing protein [Acidobacteriaceae bacterium]|nr:DUF2934 domain-containing protein [Acidobacteriaceae bacterium]